MNHFIVDHPQRIFFPYCDRPVHTRIKKNNIIGLYILLFISSYQTGRYKILHGNGKTLQKVICS